MTRRYVCLPSSKLVNGLHRPITRVEDSLPSSLSVESLLRHESFELSTLLMITVTSISTSTVLSQPSRGLISRF